MKRNVLILLVAAAAVAGGVWWRGSSRPDPVSTDRLISPERGPILRSVIAVGRVEPRTRVDLKSKAGGIIQELLVDVSDSVSEGQLLVVLDREILESRVAEAEGRLAQARGSLDSARAILAKTRTELSDPELVYAQRNWERAERLHADGIFSVDELEVAKDRRDKALYQKELLESDLVVRQAAVVAAQGRLQEVEAQTKLARQELEESTIRSPIDGVVLHRYLEPGDAVSSIRSAGGNATIIMSLGDLSQLYVDGEVDEVDVGKIIREQRIRPDLEARVTVESFAGREFLGRVTRIAPLGLEDRNGIVTFEVRIVLENPEKLLLANMTANSRIVLEEKADALLLSRGALITEGGERFALVYDERTGLTQRTRIETGISDGSRVEILAGIPDDATVLIP